MNKFSAKSERFLNLVTLRAPDGAFRFAFKCALDYEYLSSDVKSGRTTHADERKISSDEMETRKYRAKFEYLQLDQSVLVHLLQFQ